LRDVDQFVFGRYAKNTQCASHSQVPSASLGSSRDLVDQKQISSQEVRENDRFSFAEIQMT